MQRWEVLIHGPNKKIIPSLDIHHFDDRASEGSKALRRSKGAQDNGGDGDNAIIRIIYCRFRVGGSEGGRAVNE